MRFLAYIAIKSVNLFEYFDFDDLYDDISLFYSLNLLLLLLKLFLLL